MTVVPHGPDAIETWSEGCVFFPPFFIAPIAEGAARTRDPGTNGFRPSWDLNPLSVMTFSADGTAKQGCGDFKKRQTSQKRAFHKVETRDLAGRWCGCACLPLVLGFLGGPPALFCCTTKRALNEDQYDECGINCLGPICDTRTRKYVNGHPTNGFAKDGDPNDVHWYRDPGCAGFCSNPLVIFFAKKLC